MTNLIFNIDVTKAIAALKKLNQSIANTDKKAAEGFNKSEAASKRARDEFGRFVATGKKGSKSLGASIGGIAGPLGIATAGVAALSAALVALAAVATKAFIEIASEGVELNKQFETSERVFSNLFNDPNLGKQTVDFLRETADQLRVNQGEAIGFGQSILPRTGDLETFRELLRLTDIQADTTGKSLSELEFPIREALSGDFTSLADQFDLGTVGGATITKLKALGEEIGLDKALVQVLNEEFEKLGKQDIGGTLATDLKDIDSTFTNLKVTLGEPIFDELKEQAEQFLKVLDVQGEEISFVASAFGDLAANVADFIGTNVNDFISSIDFETVETLIDAFNRLFAAGELVLDILFQIPDTQTGLQQLTVSVIEAQGVLEGMAESADTARIALSAAFNFAQLFFALKKGDLSGIASAVADLSELASSESQEKSAENAEAAFAKYEARIKGVTESQKERREVEEDVNKAAINAALGAKASIEDQEEAAAEAAKAQEEITEKQVKAAEDSQKRLTDIQRKEAQKRFDDEVKNAQKREDLAAKNAEAIEDIGRKQDQAIADAGKDLTREERDLARKGARDRQQIERDAAQARVDVERGFRQQLQDIQRQFNQTAQDAERTNDAQSFLQAVRARDEQIEVAKGERGTALEDVGQGAQQQRNDLKEQLAQEVEDSKTANARKLEDLQARLNQELEAQAIKNERDFEQQVIQEQRQQEQRDLAAQRTRDEFERSEAERQEKLNASLESQFAILEAAKEKEIALIVQTEAEKTKIVVEEMARRSRALREAEEQSAQTDAPALAAGINQGRGLTPMAAGGDMAAGGSAIVGEAGPEVFTAPASGRIIPNQAMFSPPGAPSSMPNSIDNSRALNVEQMGISPGDGVLSRMVQNEMSKMLELLG